MGVCVCVGGGGRANYAVCCEGTGYNQHSLFSARKSGSVVR